MYFRILRKSLIVIGLLSVTQISTPAHAGEEIKKEELKSLQQKMKSATQLSFDFVLLKTNTIRPNKKPSQSNGHASFGKPTKFRWELIKPAGDILIFDGSTLFSLNAKDKIATKYDASGNRALEIKEVIDVVLDFDSMLKKYNLVQAIKEDANVLLKLKPKIAGGIDSIEVRVNNASASLHSLKLIFSNKNTSEFVFSNIDRSVVSPKTFEAPNDYKVINGL